MRRVAGKIELFEGQASRAVEGEVEFHGYPWYHADYWPNPRPIPVNVLGKLRDLGYLTDQEYKQALKNKLFR